MWRLLAGSPGSIDCNRHPTDGLPVVPPYLEGAGSKSGLGLHGFGVFEYGRGKPPEIPN